MARSPHGQAGLRPDVDARKAGAAVRFDATQTGRDSPDLLAELERMQREIELLWAVLEGCSCHDVQLAMVARTTEIATAVAERETGPCHPL